VLNHPEDQHCSTVDYLSSLLPPPSPLSMGIKKGRGKRGFLRGIFELLKISFNKRR
jgi:hypothetical protein